MSNFKNDKQALVACLPQTTKARISQIISANNFIPNFCFWSCSFFGSVTPFYDPMLSKIISYAPTREEAIKVLSDGLDSYVIEGVKHNAKLVQAVLRHPSFRSGKTPTSFLENEIPDFREYRYDDTDSKRSSSLLSASEEQELAAAIAVIARSREKLLGRPPVAGGGDAVVVVRPDGLFGDIDAFLVEIFLNTLLG